MKYYHFFHKNSAYHGSDIDHLTTYSNLSENDHFEDVIDQKITRLKKQGIHISACPEYFENIVEEHTIKLLSKLEAEHIQRMRDINECFRNRNLHKMEYTECLEQIEEAIVSVEAEYNMVKKLADEMNPFINGRLITEKNATKEENKHE